MIYFHGWRQLGPVVLLLAAVLSNGCYHDVTLDPRFGFTQFAGRTLVVLSPMFVARESSVGGELYIFPPGGIFPTMEDYRQKKGARGVQISALIPQGTQIKVERLLYDEYAVSGSAIPCGRFLNGELKGKSVALGFVLEKDSTSPYEWQLKSDYLAEVGSDR
jgi:hypothetical protein